mmetsp:Transcript_37315/g.100979  ORF Transcript_37315/g.100979 Transcript_37315/m.100979 type:complete len:200 (+) Transcript_37315:378-977(+)
MALRSATSSPRDWAIDSILEPPSEAFVARMRWAFSSASPAPAHIASVCCVDPLNPSNCFMEDAAVELAPERLLLIFCLTPSCSSDSECPELFTSANALQSQSNFRPSRTSLMPASALTFPSVPPSFHCGRSFSLSQPSPLFTVMGPKCSSQGEEASTGGSWGEACAGACSGEACSRNSSCALVGGAASSEPAAELAMDG